MEKKVFCLVFFKIYLKLVVIPEKRLNIKLVLLKMEKNILAFLKKKMMNISSRVEGDKFVVKEDIIEVKILTQISKKQF